MTRNHQAEDLRRCCDALEAEVTRLRAERDALRDALARIVSDHENTMFGQARAALAQEQGENNGATK